MNNPSIDQQRDKTRKTMTRWSWALMIASSALTILTTSADSRSSHNHLGVRWEFIALDVLLWATFFVVYYRQIWRLEAKAKHEMKARFEAEDERLFDARRLAPNDQKPAESSIV